MPERINRYLAILDYFRESGEISEETHRNARLWLTDPAYAEFQEQVLALIRPTPLIDAFYQVLPFGTGGRRGTVGIGSNRLNSRTIGESAQGVASYIARQDQDGSLAARGVVVAHDVRLSSAEFAVITAEVLAANGIKVYLFDGPRSTPLLSFAVRYLQAVAGVVITASHNPPSDNGFKAYWEDGGQVVAPHDQAILEAVRQVKEIERIDLERAKAQGLVEVLDGRVEDAYFKMIKRDLDFGGPRAATIVYSPLHGAGVTIVPRALQEFGFTEVRMPPSQVEMDGHFPTVPDHYPNPEVPAAMGAAIELAREVKADLAVASDPDADRLGVCLPDGKGGMVYLTGNQFQPLLLDFVLQRLQALGRLPERAYVVTTLVTTKMIRAIAEHYGVEAVDHILVGFKNVAEEMHKRELAGLPADRMVFASEESIGYMLHHEVRDKDSATAAVCAAQMAAYYKAQGKSLLQRLYELYTEHGYFADRSFSVFLYGEAGAAQMAKLMDALRNHPPREIAGLPIAGITDRRADTFLDTATGRKETLGLSKSNVLAYALGGGASVVIRPSGTEPKIKHYLAYRGSWAKRKAVDGKIAELEQAVRRLEQDILERLK